MDESCYMTRTLPSRIKLPPGSSSSPNDVGPHLGSNSTLPAPWSSSSSYQKHGQPPLQQQQLQQQQQQYQHLVHHHNPAAATKSYRGMNGVITSTPQKMSSIVNQSEPHGQHYPPPRPFSQTLPHNKYHFTPVQNPPTYHHQPSSTYHPPSAVYSQSKIASVHPTHLFNGGGVSRPYASPLRSSPPPSSSIATVKPVSMCTQNKNYVNGNRTPSPTSTLRQALNSKSTHHDSNSFHVNNDVSLRHTNGVAIRSSSSSRRNAMYLQSSSAVNVKTTAQNQPYYHQPPVQQQQQQQQQTISENWNYSKTGEANIRNNTASHPHRSLSPQDVILNYDDPSSRNSPVPQSNGTGKNGCLAKPPLPPALVDGMCPAPMSGGPRPPPRTRPKSWTSSLFNAMRNNHSSVTFQCVVEEQGVVGNGSGSAPLPGEKPSDHRPKDASELAMPLTAASASDGQKFYSLPRFQNGASTNDLSQNKIPATKTRSRTPSPFRTIIKGLVKGEIIHLMWKGRYHPSYM